jgi:hypothetical protein
VFISLFIMKIDPNTYKKIYSILNIPASASSAFSTSAWTPAFRQEVLSARKESDDHCVRRARRGVQRRLGGGVLADGGMRVATKASLRLVGFGCVRWAMRPTHWAARRISALAPRR